MVIEVQLVEDIERHRERRGTTPIQQELRRGNRSHSVPHREAVEDLVDGRLGLARVPQRAREQRLFQRIQHERPQCLRAQTGGTVRGRNRGPLVYTHFLVEWRLAGGPIEAHGCVVQEHIRCRAIAATFREKKERVSTS